MNWADETVYLIGGGPSAGRYDLAALPGITVAINDSGARLPGADVLFSASPPWIRRRLDLIRDFGGLVVVRTCYGKRAGRKFHLPGSVVTMGLRSKDRKRHNSGLEALYWTADQGARRIVLVGFDLDPSQPTNWHEGYEWQADKTADPLFNYPAWAEAFDEAARHMERAGVHVWNANPDSHIRAFPFTTLPERQEATA